MTGCLAAGRGGVGRGLDVGVQPEQLNWLGFAALAAAQFSYTLGWGSVVGVLMSELMPAAVRGLGLSAARADADAEQRRRAREDALVHIDRNEYFVGNGEL